LAAEVDFIWLVG